MKKEIFIQGFSKMCYEKLKKGFICKRCLTKDEISNTLHSLSRFSLLYIFHTVNQFRNSLKYNRNVY